MHPFAQETIVIAMHNLSCGTCTRFATVDDLDDLTWLKLDGCIERQANTKSTKWLIDLFVAAIKKKFRKFLLDGNFILILTIYERMLGALSYSMNQSTAVIENISISAAYDHGEVMHALLARALERVDAKQCRKIMTRVYPEDQCMIDVLNTLKFRVSVPCNNSQGEIEYVRYL